MSKTKRAIRGALSGGHLITPFVHRRGNFIERQKPAKAATNRMITAVYLVAAEDTDITSARISAS
jgi:hypothetical protein